MKENHGGKQEIAYKALQTKIFVSLTDYKTIDFPRFQEFTIDLC